MSVAARILPDGKVRLAAQGADARALLALPYVLKKKERVQETWWTFVPDLRRDLPGLRFLPGSAEALRARLDAVKNSLRGNDAEVLSWFDPGMPPRAYQLQGIHAGLARGRLVIADSTGLGKTPQAIGILLGLFRRGLIRRAVLVVPASLRTQWLRELSNFSDPRALPANIKVADGNARSRRAIYLGRWSVLILSPEAVRVDLEILSRISPTVGFVVVDEASILKNENQTSEAIVQAFRTVSRRLALTATPIENGLHDLWSIVRWVDPRAFLSRPFFDRRYVVWRLQTYKVASKRFGKVIERSNVVPARYRRLDEVRFKLAPVFLRRTPEEVGEELPSIVLTREVIALGKRQREVYQRVADRTKKAVAELSDQEGLLEPLQNLRCACDSTELVEEGRGNLPASAKGDRIRELLEGDFRGEQVIVFTDFAKWAHLLARDLRTLRPAVFTGDSSPVEKRVAVDSFVRGKTRVLLMTRAGERGLNLQCAGVLILADIPWNPAAIKQRVGRLRRIGSKHSSIVVRCLIAEDTVESKLILPKLDTKERLSFDVVGGDELSAVDPFRGFSKKAIGDLL